MRHGLSRIARCDNASARVACVEMRAVPLPLVCSTVLIAAMASGTVATGAAASGSFPPLIYPSPVVGRGAVSPCPNPAGLQPFTRSATAAAVASARRSLRISEAVDLRNSDRAWWPQVRAMWRRGGKAGKGLANQVVDGYEPLAESGYAVIARFSCGQALVSKSLR